MDMPAPVRILRSLASAHGVPASRNSDAGTRKRYIPQPFAPARLCLVALLAPAFYQGSPTAQSKGRAKQRGDGDETGFSRKRSNRGGDADDCSGRGG